MDRTFLALAAITGFLGVALGAFGAHGLEGKVSPDLMRVFETGVRYHMYHALALLGVGAAWPHRACRSLNVAGWCFVAGIVIFSGSLYVLTLSGMRWLGAVTPIGGLAFLAGWVAVFNAAIRRPS